MALLPPRVAIAVHPATASKPSRPRPKAPVLGAASCVWAVKRGRPLLAARVLARETEVLEGKSETESEVKPKVTNTRNLTLWPGITDTLVDFGGLQVPQRLADAFTERGIVQPSEVQEMVMPKLSRGEHIIIHAPTGGGKTLSYLLPMLSRLQPTMHVGIQALILVPTPELALQVGRELKWLIYTIAGGSNGMCWFNPQVPQEIACQVLLSRSNLWDAVRQDTAVMICTPGLILSELRLLKWEARRFTETLAMFMASNVNTIICDEVDALTPSSPTKGPQKLGPAESVCGYVVDVVRRRYRNRPIQLIASSATSNSKKVAAFLDRLMEKKYSKRRDAGRRSTPELVQALGRLERVAAVGQTRRKGFVPMPQGIEHYIAVVEDKDQGPLIGTPRYEAMCSIVKSLQAQGTILVFVPERVKLDAMVMLLRKAGVGEVSKYRSEVGLSPTTEQIADPKFERRVRQNSSWRGRPAEQDINPLLALQQYQDFIDLVSEGSGRVLVAKVGDGRGIDVPNVSHVVLLELPEASGDYLHLAGRTGRMGRMGRAITICTETERRNVIDGVEFRLGIGFDLWDIEKGKPSEMVEMDQEEKEQCMEDSEP